MRRMLPILLLLTACTPTVWVPPTTPMPEPGYVPVEASAEAAWDAVIDVLADFGVDFDYISPEMRFAKISGVLAHGPVIRVTREGTMLRPARADTTPHLQAVEWADCGTIDGENMAGWGTLFADFSIRVREHQGAGIVKVVVPDMWMYHHAAVQPDSAPRLRCVSRGTFEQVVLERIQQRVRPIVLRRGSG